MSSTLDDTEMTFNSLQRTNKKLASNPELSEHNKEVLEDFFKKARSGGSGKAILRDYSSRFNKLAEVIDFKLDEASKEDIEEIYAKFNQDRIKKNNGSNYADISKDKFDSTLKKFYNWFIKKQGKGYNPDLNGPELVEDVEMNISLSTEVNPDRLPTPKEVRKVGKHAQNLRDQTLILLLWSTGARVGEMFKTEYNDYVLRWNNITFQEDKVWVELKGKTGKREIPVKTGKPLLEKYYKETDANPEDPVFKQINNKTYCPECKSHTSLEGSNTTEKSKKYSCKKCEWTGNGIEAVKKKPALSDDAVRRILERTIERSGLKGEFKENPHDFGRKSRAVYKARIGNTEHQLRAFFGWSETSDSPKHYIECVKEDLEKALAEEFGEDVEYDNGYDEEALRPVECVSCGQVNSPVQDLCIECGNALTDQGEEVTRSESSQGLSDSLSELAEEQDIPTEEFAEMLENKSAIELMKKLT
jgi:site-specific recombinase XerD